MSYYDFARPEVVELVPREAKRILDIGCGAGALGAALKARQDCVVVGLEKDRKAAAVAEDRLDEVLVANVERPPKIEGSFDCIICADILEHLADPARVLTWARELLTDDGVLLISIPNSRNWQVLAGLAEGNFTRESAGLLDRTHRQVFTRREMEKLLDQTGWFFPHIVAVPGPGYAEWVEQGKRCGVKIGRMELTHLTEEETMDIYTYQWLFVAQSRPMPDYGLTSIVIPAWDGLPHTIACLESIGCHTPEKHEVIVVNNGSTDGTREWLEARPDIKAIHNETNLGFPVACNQGMKAARGDQIVLLNNDTIVTPGWLRRMIEAMNTAPDIGLVGPRSNSVSGPQQIAQVGYNALTELDGWAWEWGKRRRGEVMPVSRLVGFCLLIRQEVIEQVGVFDERFGLGNFEDDDLAKRAQAAGWKLLIANDSFIHHWGGQTFAAHGVDFAGLMAANQQIFNEKWADNS